MEMETQSHFSAADDFATLKIFGVNPEAHFLFFAYVAQRLISFQNPSLHTQLIDHLDQVDPVVAAAPLAQPTTFQGAVVGSDVDLTLSLLKDSAVNQLLPSIELHDASASLSVPLPYAFRKQSPHVVVDHDEEAMALDILARSDIAGDNNAYHHGCKTPSSYHVQPPSTPLSSFNFSSSSDYSSSPSTATTTCQNTPSLVSESDHSYYGGWDSPVSSAMCSPITPVSLRAGRGGFRYHPSDMEEQHKHIRDLGVAQLEVPCLQPTSEVASSPLSFHEDNNNDSAAALLATASTESTFDFLPTDIVPGQQRSETRLTSTGRPSHAKKQPPGHVKRPRNAFILYRTYACANRLIPSEYGECLDCTSSEL
jgi:hypothetical protein